MSAGAFLPADSSGNHLPHRRRLTTMRAGSHPTVWIAITVTVLTLVAACDSPPTTTDDSDWGPLAVVPGTDAGDGALIQGILEIDGQCVLLDARGEKVLLIWPDDRTVWNEDTQTVTFVRTNGEEVLLRDGDEIAFGGGGSSAGEDRQGAEEFVVGIEWTAEPEPVCVSDHRWFIYDLLP